MCLGELVRDEEVTLVVFVMEAFSASETSVRICQTTLRCVSQDTLIVDSGGCSSLCSFGFRVRAAPKADKYPVFRQTLQLPSSGLRWSGWTILEALYRIGSKWRLLNSPIRYTFTLKMATAVFSGTLGNIEHSGATEITHARKHPSRHCFYFYVLI
jgi:hypothetical protein